MESQNEDAGWEESWKYLNDDDLNQSSQNQLAMEGTTKDVSAVPSNGVKADNAAALILERTRETNHGVAGSGVELEGKTTEMLSQNQTVVKTEQSILTDTSCNEADAANLDHLGRKIKTDQVCLQQVVKMEEELQTLRREKALMQEKLESAESDIEKLKHKGNSQQNISQLCKITFELNLPDNEAKAEVMKIVGGFPGITNITMDMKDKKLSLKGDDIDPLTLREKLKNICNTKLVSFYVVEPKEYPKKEEKKEAPGAPTPLFPYHRGPPYPYMGPDYYGPATMQHFNLKTAAIMCVLFLVFLFLVRFAP